MQRSTDRILTTHAGSLARPADLLAMVRAKVPASPTTTRPLQRGCAPPWLVRWAADGRWHRRGERRRTGQTGIRQLCKRPSSLASSPARSPPRMPSDQAEFPDFQPPEGGTLNTRRMVCIGPLGWKDRTAVQTDIENFQAALQTVQPTEAFLPTVSPGTLAQNVINEYYKDERSLPVGGRRGDARGMCAIVQAGFLLQIDSPDLAIGSLPVPGQDPGGVPHHHDPARRGPEPRPGWHPPERVRHHICWGNGERPHPQGRRTPAHR